MAKTIALLPLLLVLPLTPGAAPAQEPATPPVRVRWTGLAQAQLSTSSIDAADGGGRAVVGSTVDMRRVRIGAEVAIREWITGKIEADVAMARLSPTDVWMNLQLTDGFGLRFGQFKKPFSAVELSSSSRMPPIERSVRIRGLGDLAATIDSVAALGGTRIHGDEHAILDQLRYLGRDIGAAANGAVGRLEYQVGVFNGAGQNATDENDGKSIAGRIAYRLGRERPLRLGAAVSRRETVVADEDRAGTAVEVDIEWGDFRRPGLRMLAEAAAGENLASGDDLRGAQLWAGWFAPMAHPRVEGLEPLVRFSYADPGERVSGDDGLLITPGINLYFFGRNRLMLNWDLFLPGATELDPVHALRAQAQLHF